MNKLQKIFNRKNNIVIGAVHLPPLLGYSEFPGLDVAINNAKKDIVAFARGGAHGVIFENNYDIPHQALVNTSVAISMATAGREIRKATQIPLGVNVLWNDFYTSLSLAKLLDLQFIRVPVFVDKVKTSCGIIAGKAKEVTDFRKKIGTKNVAIFADIHVKHSKLLSKQSLIGSAKLAAKSGADAIILTGNWTGQAPDLGELIKVRKTIGSFPILAGSGVNKNNIASIMKVANGVIVSTSLKEGAAKKRETNVKTYDQRIDANRVRILVRKI